LLSTTFDLYSSEFLCNTKPHDDCEDEESFIENDCEDEESFIENDCEDEESFIENDSSISCSTS